MGKYSLEVLELRDRVQQGNKKLTEAWPQIRTITDEGKRREQVAKWNGAIRRLQAMCGTLQKKGSRLLDGLKPATLIRRQTTITDRLSVVKSAL